METLHHHCQVMTSLVPIARQGALVYNILCQIGRTTPQRQQSWQHFSELYSRALGEFVQHHPDTSKTLCAGGDVSAVVEGILQKLSQTLLQDAFRYDIVYTYMCALTEHCIIPFCLPNDYHLV